MKKLEQFFLALDIETSTKYDADGKPVNVWLNYGFCNLYSIEKREATLKCYFEKWQELEVFFTQISIKFAGYEICCFVHNLSYEFDFLIKNISKGVEILANSSHNIICGKLEKYPQIKFRCTYQLTGLPLKKMGEYINLPKLESEYRTLEPWEKPTQQEIEYCNRDVDIVSEYLKKVYVPKYGRISKIPYTKTGVVRAVLKNFARNCSNKKWDLYPPENCYAAMLKAFRGGICISNPLFTGVILKKVKSFDEASAYPYVMLAEPYPTTIKKTLITSLESLTLFDFYIVRLKIKNIESKYSWGWLSYSTIESYAAMVHFNGKIIEATDVDVYLSSVDYHSLLKTYEISGVEVLEFYECSDAGQIAQPIRDTLVHYAEAKSKAKKTFKEEPTIENERSYALAKADFNSIYGMNVQKLTNNKFEIVGNEWVEIEDVYRFKPNSHLNRNFLYGVFITAYARRNLILAIITNCPDTFVYADTDSIKYINVDNQQFTDTNKRLIELQDNEAVRELGTFEYEGTYEEFLTWGAKKYATVKNGELHLTVAGLPKTAKIDRIEDFKPGVEFKDCKLGKKYLENANKEHYGEGGVALYPTGYLLDITDNDRIFIEEEHMFLGKFLKNHKAERFLKYGKKEEKKCNE